MDADTPHEGNSSLEPGRQGIGIQDLLVNGTPDDIAEDVVRIKELLGPCLIVSPSHEALLQNVSPENVVAMAQAAIAR